MFLSATVHFRRAWVQGLFGNSGQTDRNWRSLPRQITFPIKIRDENQFQARFWCEDRHATGAETCLLIRGPWFAKPLLFTWWSARRGFSFAGPPRGLAGRVPMACQCAGRPQGMSRHGLQPGSPDVGTCTLRKVRVTVHMQPLYTHMQFEHSLL